MLTFQELKSIINIPIQGEKNPSAKQLKNQLDPILVKKLGDETVLYAYQNGYAMYSVGKNTTVFSITACKDYCYHSTVSSIQIGEQSFDEEPWFIRLMLEGEDRLFHNHLVKEYAKTISYNALSGDWEGIADSEITSEHCIWCETLDLILNSLTSKQRKIFCEFYLEEKSQKQIAEKIGISIPAVSKLLSRANQRACKTYLLKCREQVF